MLSLGSATGLATFGPEVPVAGWSRARKAHLAAAAVWTVLVIPTLLWWHDSILWVAFMSLYANVGVHLAGATRGGRRG